MRRTSLMHAMLEGFSYEIGREMAKAGLQLIKLSDNKTEALEDLKKNLDELIKPHGGKNVVAKKK